jgi:UrcA family protein
MLVEPCLPKVWAVPGMSGRNQNLEETAMKNSLTRFVTLSAGIAFLGLAGATTAAQPDAFKPLQMSVSYADLNIASAAGAKALYNRLQFAALRVCAPFDDGQHRIVNFQFRSCYRNALDSAVAKINQPTLTAMHSRALPAAGG